MKIVAKIPVLATYKVSNDAAQHLARAQLCGIDFYSFSGKRRLLAMLDGQIVYVHAGYNPAQADNPATYDSLGRFIVQAAFVDGIPVWIRYCHNDVFNVSAGQDVAAGETIGTYGNTGLSDGAHVHVDFWTAPESIERATAIGMPSAKVFNRAPWPGADMLVNVNPTEMLKAAGLDVINSTGTV